MLLNQILTNINSKLAGENLSYEELKPFLDDTVDDLNSKLSSKYPVFSEFTAANYAHFPNYNFFPDKYIRSVVCLGAAYRFYLTDEEGSTSAIEYAKLYTVNLFTMVRDFSQNVPEKYQDLNQGFLVDPNETNASDFRWGSWE